MIQHDQRVSSYHNVPLITRNRACRRCEAGGRDAGALIWPGPPTPGESGVTHLGLRVNHCRLCASPGSWGCSLP